MREKITPTRSGTALAAFWWTLAAVHLVPIGRIALTIPDDPVRHAATIAVLIAVIGFCLFAATRARSMIGRRRPRGATLAFLLAAMLAHHDAVGQVPEATVPVPVLATALVVTGAVMTARFSIRAALRRWRTAAGRLAAAFTAAVDRLLARGLCAATVGGHAPAAARRAAAARGPPA